MCMPSILGGECEPHRALQDESEEQLKQKHQELEEVKEAVHRILGGLGDDPTGWKTHGEASGKLREELQVLNVREPQTGPRAKD